MVADVLASVEREKEYLSRAQEATTNLIEANMARIRGLAMIQGTHRVSFAIEYVFDFTPGKQTIDTAIAIRSTVREKGKSHAL